jgi:hypothetical protein
LGAVRQLFLRQALRLAQLAHVRRQHISNVHMAIEAWL